MSSRRGYEEESKSDKVKEVHIDGLVLMKMIKHCRESLPTYVSGSLLGLDVRATLEVTNAFPFPSSDGDDGADFQIEMLKALREANVDNNQIGWYTSTYLGACTKDVILTQYDFQSSPIGANAVVISYDPLRSTTGNVALKALRLTGKFMRAMNAKRVSHSSLAMSAFKPGAIFEEVPIKIRNPKLVDALLLDLADKADLECDFSRLDLSCNPFLEKSTGLLIDQIDELAALQNNAQYWERKLASQRKAQEEFFEALRVDNDHSKTKGEPTIPVKPEAGTQAFKGVPDYARQDKLESLLIAAQIGTYCEQINAFAGQSFAKLFLAEAVHA